MLTGLYTNCELCGKQVYKTQTEYKKSKHHYCSYDCANKARHNRMTEDRRCEVCGKVFRVRKSVPQRFCSVQCQHEWQKTNVGSKNPKFGGKALPCDWCGEVFDAKKYNLEKYEHHFCCSECRRMWYSNVFSQQSSWREESKKRAAKILSDGKIDVDTKPQKIINRLLDDMNITYSNEENFTYYAVDNYLTEHNLIVEVMGDFWHCNPVKYPEGPKCEIQKTRIPKDKAKQSYIKHIYDIDILYVWENDIYYNINTCKMLIDAYVKNDGCLLNYHSFNYCIRDNRLELNTDIISPYFEKNKPA